MVSKRSWEMIPGLSLERFVRFFFMLYIQGSLSKVYEKVRRDLLATIDNEELKERLVGGGLPSKDCLRTSATTARCVPKAPDSHDEINLQGVPYKDGTAEKYLLRRSTRPGEDRDILLMGTSRTVKQFVHSKFKSGDATFSCAPKLFYQVKLALNNLTMSHKKFIQVYIFMCLTSKSYTITMMCLMPDKTRDSYDRMFSLLYDYCSEHELDTQWIGSTFMTDFEVAMRSSIVMFFPAVNLMACFFHFCQRMVFYMKAAGLQTLNEKDHEFNSFMRRLNSLPLVPKTC